MAEWTPAAAQDPVQGPWEGFASAHTWIYTKHSWWHLIPRPINAAVPTDGITPLGLDSPCHVLTAYNPGGRAAAEVDNRAAARALRADPRLGGLVLLPSFGGHPDGAWLEPGVAVIGLSRHQAQLLGQAYGQLAVYELVGTIRRVVACESDRVLVQAVVCQHERQPPTPTPSPRPLPAQRRGDLDHGAQARCPPAWRRSVGPPG
jgi:Protein of unknown function (DUF3293)